MVSCQPFYLHLNLHAAYCALARPWEGLIIGAIGGLITCLSVPLIERIKVDDPVGVIPVHCIAAVWGMLAVGLFGEMDELEDFLAYNGKVTSLLQLSITRRC